MKYVKQDMLAFLVIHALLSCVFVPFGFTAASYESQALSMNLDNQPLHNVLARITKKTGYRIEVNKELLDLPVSGHFKDCSLTEFMSRLLKGRNLFILEDQSSKTLVIKSSRSVPSGSIVVFDQHDENTINYVERVQRQQRDIDKRITIAPESIEARPGVTLLEHHGEQKMIDRKISENPNVVRADSQHGYDDLLASCTRLDRQFLVAPALVQASPANSYQHLLDDQEHVDALIADGARVDAEPGLTYGGLVRLQEQLDRDLARKK